MKKNETLLVYDRECPVCDLYCTNVRTDKELSELRIVNAREDSKVMDEISDQGLDIDQGMVLKLNDQLYYGSDAIHQLALISDRSNWFNRFNYYVFKSKPVSNCLYPILRLSRNLLLKILGKSKINNLKVPDNNRF